MKLNGSVAVPDERSKDEGFQYNFASDIIHIMNKVKIVTSYMDASQRAPNAK